MSRIGTRLWLTKTVVSIADSLCPGRGKVIFFWSTTTFRECSSNAVSNLYSRCEIGSMIGPLRAGRGKRNLNIKFQWSALHATTMQWRLDQT